MKYFLINEFYIGLDQIIIKQNYNNYHLWSSCRRLMKSGQKIGLTSTLIKQKIQNAKSNQPQQVVPPPVKIDDKLRLRKKIEQYKRIQRRQYPKKKAAIQQPEPEPIPQINEEEQKQRLERQRLQQQQALRNQEAQKQLQKEKLQTQMLQQYLDNQFYDQQCIEADKQLQNKKGDDVKYKKKIRKVNSIMQRLSKSVNQLKNRYDEMEIAQIISKRRNKKKQAQCKAFVLSQIEQKEEMVKKVQAIKEKEEKKFEQIQKKKLKQEEKQKENKLKQLKKIFEQKKKQKEEQKKINQKKAQKVRQLMSRYEHQKPLYVVYQQKFEKKQNKQKQIQKAYLKKRRQQFKPFDDEQFTAHLKQHDQKIKDCIQIKQQQKIEKSQKIMQQNLKLADKLYRGKNYERIQQEQEQRQREKQKRKQRKERIKKYQAYVKQNFKPQVKENEDDEENLQNSKVSQQKKSQNSDEDQDDDQQKEEKQDDKYPKFRKIKRYKFLQGKSCGQIIETIKMPLSERLQRRVGDSYLQMMKSLPKKPRQIEDKSLVQQQNTESKSARSRVQIPKMPRPKHFNIQLSDKPHRQQIGNILILLKSKDEMVQFKRKHLNNLQDKSQFQNVQSEINTNIIENIQRKLSLLNKL